MTADAAETREGTEAGDATSGAHDDRENAGPAAASETPEAVVDGDAAVTGVRDVPSRHRFMADGPEQRFAALPPLLDRYANALSVAVQARVRTPVPVTRELALASSHADLCADMRPDALHAACTLASLPGEIWWVADRALIAGLADRWFGGPGACDVDERALSISERRLAEALFDAATSALADSLRPQAPPALTRLTDATAGRLARHAPAGGCIACTYRLGTGTGEGLLRLVLSPSMLAQLDGDALQVPSRNTPSPAGVLPVSGTGGGALADVRWLQGMRGCEIELNGVLAESSITLGDVMRLAKGDFIALDERQTVSFRVDGRAVFDASIGTVDGRASANVTRLHAPDDRG